MILGTSSETSTTFIGASLHKAVHTDKSYVVANKGLMGITQTFVQRCALALERTARVLRTTLEKPY